MALLWLTPCPAPADGDLARINASLEAWIERIDSDRPYLLLDGSARELRLQHGTAILRVAPVLTMPAQLTGGPRQRLRAHLRRYAATPFQRPTAGPFDWENYLAQAADEDCALWFADGLLLYGHDIWERATLPSAVRLAPEDLRALYDAVSDSVQIVLLPVDWDGADGRRGGP